MGVFDWYQDLGEIRDEVDNYELRDIYSNVLKRYRDSLDDEDYLTSFILIQSLLEDRIYVLYRLYSSVNGSQLSLETLHRSYTLMRCIKDLTNDGWIPHLLSKDLITSTHLRNKFIHYSFIGLEHYDHKLSDGFYQLFRSVDKLIRSNNQ